MKIVVLENLNPVEVIRRSGYGQVMDRRASEISWSRRLGEGVYPRFHVYINGGVINLHLDQKQASYQGSSAHNGEYDGEAVEKEVERIIEIMKNINNQTASQDNPKNEEKKSFWSRFFG